MKAPLSFSLCGSLLFKLALTTSEFDPANYAAKDIITRDVAVIGGGSSGVYAAINLRAKGKSVVVVEKEPALGGHTNSYTDPATNISVDYGVQAFWNSKFDYTFIQ
jgi:heterodisulfide reductase subunit A-like polyferredoxin